MIPEVEVHRTTNANESDRLSIKKTGDAASQLLEKKTTDDPKQIKVLKLHSTCYGRQSIAARNECFSMIGQYEFFVSSEIVVCTQW